jgi:hypothetical protein
MGDLDKALTELRNRATAHIEAALKDAGPSASPGSSRLTPRAKTLALAKVRAENEYSSFTEQSKTVQTIFNIVPRGLQLKPNFEPRFP